MDAKTFWNIKSTETQRFEIIALAAPSALASHVELLSMVGFVNLPNNIKIAVYEYMKKAGI